MMPTWDEASMEARGLAAIEGKPQDDQDVPAMLSLKNIPIPQGSSPAGCRRNRPRDGRALLDRCSLVWEGKVWVWCWIKTKTESLLTGRFVESD